MLKTRLLGGLLIFALGSYTYAQELRSQRGIFGAGQPGEVSVVRMEAKKLGLKNFEMESRQVDGRLAIDAFTGQLGRGTLSGRGLVDWSRPEEAQRMTIQVQNVDAMDLFRAFKVKLSANVEAVTNGVIDTQWRGVRGNMPRRTMNGTVRLLMGPGRITGAAVLQQVATYTGIADLQQLEFGSATIEGTIRDGMMSITKAEITGQSKSAKGAGLMDLRTEEIKIRFDGWVSPQHIASSSLPQVRELSSKSSSGLIKLPLPVVMSGQVRDPQFNMAWESGGKKGSAD